MQVVVNRIVSAARSNTGYGDNRAFLEATNKLENSARQWFAKASHAWQQQLRAMNSLLLVRGDSLAPIHRALNARARRLFGTG